MSGPSPRFWEIFFEVYEPLPRQGPGNRACATQALGLCHRTRRCHPRCSISAAASAGRRSTSPSSPRVPCLRVLRGAPANLTEGHEAWAIPSEYRGWWRITETSQWVNDGLDILRPALLSLSGHDDRLRLHCLLAYVNCKPTKTGVSFTWEGAWEYDQMSGEAPISGS